MRKLTIPLLAGALGVLALAVPSGAAPSRAAVTKTTMTLVTGGNQLIPLNGRAGAFGNVSPSRPLSEKAYMEQRRGGTWHVVSSAKFIGHNGGNQWQVDSPSLGSYGLKTFRVCARATSKYSAACTKVFKDYVGKWHWLASLPTASHSANFSTGPLTIENTTRYHSVRFNVATVNGFVSYNLHGKCAYATTGYGIDDGATNMTDATFSIYEEGQLYQSANIGYGPYGQAEFKLYGLNAIKLTTKVGHAQSGRSGYLGFAMPKLFCGFS